MIEDFVECCDLLAKPENQIKMPGGQYVSREVNARQEQDMTNEMSRELVWLPRFIAYAKVLQERSGVEECGRGKYRR